MKNTALIDLNLGKFWRKYGVAVAWLRQGDWGQIVAPHRARWLVVIRPALLSVFVAESRWIDGKVCGEQVYTPRWRWVAR